MTDITNQAKPTKRIPGGMLIAFEGVDGSGKTTQARAARDFLAASGYEGLYLREPTDGPVGRRIRELMVAGRDAVAPMDEFRLFLDDRTQDVRENIAPALARGAVICLDRYYISSMAYQGALGLDPEFIRAENEKIAPRPDLILLYRIPVEQSLARIAASRSAGHNLFERHNYQQRVHEIFEAMRLPNLVRIDAARPVEMVIEGTMSEIKARLAAKQPG
jgi:dTMP kinase